MGFARLILTSTIFVSLLVKKCSSAAWLYANRNTPNKLLPGFKSGLTGVWLPLLLLVSLCKSQPMKSVQKRLWRRF
jgi:hypothetical protein